MHGNEHESALHLDDEDNGGDGDLHLDGGNYDFVMDGDNDMFNLGEHGHDDHDHTTHSMDIVTLDSSRRAPRWLRATLRDAPREKLVLCRFERTHG